MGSIIISCIVYAAVYFYVVYIKYAPSIIAKVINGLVCVVFTLFLYENYPFHDCVLEVTIYLLIIYRKVIWNKIVNQQPQMIDQPPKFNQAHGMNQGPKSSIHNPSDSKGTKAQTQDKSQEKLKQYQLEQIKKANEAMNHNSVSSNSAHTSSSSSSSMSNISDFDKSSTSNASSSNYDLKNHSVKSSTNDSLSNPGSPKPISSASSDSLNDLNRFIH